MENIKNSDSTTQQIKNYKKIPLYVDFDGTIVNTPKRITQMLNLRFHFDRIWWKMYQYDCNDIFPELTIEQVCEVFAEEAFFNHQLKKKFLCEYVLCKLQDYFDIQIVTLGTELNLKYKEIWCNENLKFKFTFVGLRDFDKKKSVVDMSDGIIIDDHVKMLESCNARYKILIKGFLKKDWNDMSNYSYDNDMYFLSKKSWFGIGKALNRIIRSRKGGTF